MVLLPKAKFCKCSECGKEKKCKRVVLHFHHVYRFCSHACYLDFDDKHYCGISRFEWDRNYKQLSPEHKALYQQRLKEVIRLAKPLLKQYGINERNPNGKNPTSKNIKRILRSRARYPSVWMRPYWYRHGVIKDSTRKPLDNCPKSMLR